MTQNRVRILRFLRAWTLGIAWLYTGTMTWILYTNAMGMAFIAIPDYMNGVEVIMGTLTMGGLCYILWKEK